MGRGLVRRRDLDLELESADAADVAESVVADVRDLRVWWDRAERATAPELVSEAALENLAADEPVGNEVA